MSCTLTLTGRAYPCKTGIGGIKRIYIAAFHNAWEALTAGAVAGVTSAKTYYSFEVSKNSSSFVQTINSSIENGTIFYTQVVDVSLPKLSAADNEEISKMLQARLSVIVQDANDNLLIMGYGMGAEASGGEVTTGTAKGDMNGYKFQLTAEELYPAPHLASTAGVPTDADITLTAGN